MRGARDRLVGVASMRFFDANGSLVMGLQKRPFEFTDKMPSSWDPAAPPSGREAGENGMWCRAASGGEHCFDEEIPREDCGFLLERVSVSFFFSLSFFFWFLPLAKTFALSIIAILCTMYIQCL